MNTIWDFVLAKLKEGQKLVLMLVIESTGSSPGRRGFKMVVAQDGDLQGSIGGGVMEYRLTEEARKLLPAGFSPFLRRQDHHKENSKDPSGMICSGKQMVAFYMIDASHLPLVETLTNSRSGRLFYTDEGIRFSESDRVEKEQLEIHDEKHWSYSEHHGYGQYLYIFGAGHVSVAVSRLFRQLGFYVTVFDNRREELNTFQLNRYAHFKKIIDYNSVVDYIPEGDHVYVTIMTFAHKNDRDVLEQLVGKKIKYLGMMGSETKVDKLFKDLEDKGIPRELLDRVDAPIGLSIHSQTPDEIAVSIAAKIIMVKNS